MSVYELAVQRNLARFRVAVMEAGTKLTYQHMEIFREVGSALEHPSAENARESLKPATGETLPDHVARTGAGALREHGPCNG